MTITPFGATAQTTAQTSPYLQQSQPVRQYKAMPNNKIDQPRWYDQMMKTGYDAFKTGLNNGTLQGAPGYGNAKQQYNQLYGGYNGSTPVQPGLLGLAANGLSRGNAYAMPFAQQYLNKYANLGINGGNPGNLNGFNRLFNDRLGKHQGGLLG